MLSLDHHQPAFYTTRAYYSQEIFKVDNTGKSVLLQPHTYMLHALGPATVHFAWVSQHQSLYSNEDALLEAEDGCSRKRV